MKKLACFAAFMLCAVGLAYGTSFQGDVTVGDDLVVTDDASVGGDLTVTGSITSSGAFEGVPGGGGTATGATATESYGQVHKTVLVLDGVSVVMAEGGAATNGVGSKKIYDFPAGVIGLIGTTVDSFTVVVDTNDLDNADNGDFSLGSAAAGGASGLAATEVNFCPSTALTSITNVTGSALAAPATLNGASSAVDLYLNMEVDDGDISAAVTNTVSATITIHWVNLGDY